MSAEIAAAPGGAGDSDPHAKVSVVASLLQLGALAGLFAGLFAITRALPASEVSAGVGTVAAVGFLLLAGTLAGNLVELIGLPHLTGYLFAGIVAGPHLLQLFDEHAVHDLSQVNTLALALIALEGGAHLRLGLFKEGLRGLVWATFSQHFFVLLIGAVAFFALRPWLPFASGLPFAAMIGAALLWGTISITRSPAATLGILAETKAKGPLIDRTLAFVMLSDIVVILILAVSMAIARSLLDPLGTFSLNDFTSLAHDTLGSIALGATIGLALAAYLRFLGAHLILLLVALGFGLSEALLYLRFDSLLTFMVAGFVIRNLSEQGEKLIHSIEATGSVVYVVFFATAGAHLDLPALARLWPLALAFAVIRGFATWGSARFGSARAGDSPALKKWGWTGLISQAGLALGVAELVARTFPKLGRDFAALAIASLAINELVGPVLFKIALARSKESATSRKDSEGVKAA